MLNALCRKNILIQSSKFSTFSSVGGRGIFVGSGGGGNRLGQPHSAVEFDTDTDDADKDDVCDTDGNWAGRMLRSIKALSDSKQPLVFREKYIIALPPQRDRSVNSTPVR